MVLEVISAIVEKILDEFGAGYKIYKTEARQNLSLPCFFVLHNKTDIIPELGKRFHEKNVFEIDYLPAIPGKYIELLGVACRLLDVLGSVDTPTFGTLYGSNFSYSIKSENLKFFVNYNARLMRTIADSTANLMDDVSYGAAVQ